MLTLRSATVPSDEELVRWSLDNPGFRFEYFNGEVTVSPTTAKSGVRTSALNQKLGAWAKSHGYRSFGSSTLLAFGGLKVSPDEVLLRAERFAALSDDDQDQALSLPPDIAVEIVSKSQNWGKARGGVEPKCKAMSEAGVLYVVMLDPYASIQAERVTTWGAPPPDFPTDWDDVLNA